MIVKRIKIFLILIGILIMIISFSGCINEEDTDRFLGVSLSPKSYQGDEFLDFFEKVNKIGNMVMWAGMTA